MLDRILAANEASLASYLFLLPLHRAKVLSLGRFTSSRGHRCPGGPRSCVRLLTFSLLLVRAFGLALPVFYRSAAVSLGWVRYSSIL